jgi:hypothetical protein
MSPTRWILTLFLICGSTLALAESKPAPPSATARDGWPESRAGQVGRGWVRAFSTGDSAMREFYRREMDPEALAKKSMESRIESYRKLRERLGRLSLDTVVREAPAELVVQLLDSDATRQEFTFTIQTSAPHKLLSVSFKDKRHFHGGFHH